MPATRLPRLALPFQIAIHGAPVIRPTHQRVEFSVLICALPEPRPLPRQTCLQVAQSAPRCIPDFFELQHISQCLSLCGTVGPMTHISRGNISKRLKQVDDPPIASDVSIQIFSGLIAITALVFETGAPLVQVQIHCCLRCVAARLSGPSSAKAENQSDMALRTTRDRFSTGIGARCMEHVRAST